MVYFLQRRDGLVKIGYTDSLKQRIQVLTSAHSKKLHSGKRMTLRLLATVEGGREREKELHQQFRHCRVEGEFFQKCDCICQFVSCVNPKFQRLRSTYHSSDCPNKTS